MQMYIITILDMHMTTTYYAPKESSKAYFTYCRTFSLELTRQ